MHDSTNSNRYRTCMILIALTDLHRTCMILIVLILIDTEQAW